MQVTLDKKEVSALFKKLNKLSVKDRASVSLKTIKRSLVEGEGIMRTQIAGKKIFKSHPTGNLAKTIENKFNIKGLQVIGVIGSGVRTGRRMKYADILDTGGKIKSKGKKLTVPLRAAKTRTGAPKRTKAEAWENTFIIKIRGNTFIVQKAGKNKLTFLYILKNEVQAPARKYISKIYPKIYKNTVKNLKKMLKEVIR